MVLVSWTFLSVCYLTFISTSHDILLVFYLTARRLCKNVAHFPKKLSVSFERKCQQRIDRKRKFLMMRSLTASASRPSSFDSNQRLLLQQCLEDRFLASNSSWNFFEQSSLLLFPALLPAVWMPLAAGALVPGCWEWQAASEAAAGPLVLVPTLPVSVHTSARPSLSHQHASNWLRHGLSSSNSVTGGGRGHLSYWAQASPL